MISAGDRLSLFSKHALFYNFHKAQHTAAKPTTCTFPHSYRQIFLNPHEILSKRDRSTSSPDGIAYYPPDIFGRHTLKKKTDVERFKGHFHLGLINGP